MFNRDPKIPKLKFDQDLCGTCDMNSTLGSVVLLAMFLDALASLDFKLSVSQGCFSAIASPGLLELY